MSRLPSLGAVLRTGCGLGLGVRPPARTPPRPDRAVPRFVWLALPPFPGSRRSQVVSLRAGHSCTHGASDNCWNHAIRGAVKPRPPAIGASTRDRRVDRSAARSGGCCERRARDHGSDAVRCPPGAVVTSSSHGMAPAKFGPAPMRASSRQLDRGAVIGCGDPHRADRVWRASARGAA